MDENQQNDLKGNLSAPEASSSGGETHKDDGSARSRLIEAATKLFAEHGLDGTSTRDIAKAAELNISLISYYFGGKEGLYKAVIHEFASKIQRQGEKILSGVDLQNLDRESFRSSMRAVIFEMVPMKFASREIHSLLQREMMAGLPHSKDVYENVFSKILETIVSLYVTGQKKGFVKKELNPYIVFFSMVHAADTYFQMSQCQTSVQKKILQIPKQMKEYSEQLYLIFVEGVLL
jgi:AcrR family transcriptional regulator